MPSNSRTLLFKYIIYLAILTTMCLIAWTVVSQVAGVLKIDYIIIFYLFKYRFIILLHQHVHHINEFEIYWMNEHLLDLIISTDVLLFV